MAPHAHLRPARPAAVGVGLRAPHTAEVLSTHPRLDWLEVHAENYLHGGPALARLEAVRRDYDISLHAVGLSLGSAEGIDRDHLAGLTALAARIEPMLVSDHLSWSVGGGTYLNDLLPLPYTDEALARVADNVSAAQDALQCPLLVENPSRYLSFRDATWEEPAFLAELARRTGCRLLCDVNNIHVTCCNLAQDADAYLAALPPAAIGEIHLAGHSAVTRNGHDVLIDDHGARVAPAVWDLYVAALHRFGAVPTLIEWDTDLPALAVLLDEACIAADLAAEVLHADAA